MIYFEQHHPFLEKFLFFLFLSVMGIRAIVSTLLVIVAILVVGAAFFSLLYRKRK